MEDSPKSPLERSQDLFKAVAMPETPAEETEPSVTMEAFPVEVKQRRKPRSRSGVPSPDSLIGSNWPSLPVPSTSKIPQAAPSASSSASHIPPGQVARNCSPSPSRTSASWKLQMKGLEDNERDRVGKYA